MHGCGYSGFVAIRALVNFGVNPLEAFFLFCWWKHVEHNGDKTKAVRPSECKQVEAPDAFANDMVKYKRQQLHSFAASSVMKRLQL